MAAHSMPMKSSTIRIPFGPLLPWAFHILAAVAAVVAMLLLARNPLLALVIFGGVLFVFTGTEGTEIDMERKRYREYTSLFFMRSGEWIDFDEIEKVYINKNKMRQRLSTYRSVHTAEFFFPEFSVYLKFNEEEKVQLQKNKVKRPLVKKAQLWAEQLNVPLYDYAAEAE